MSINLNRGRGRRQDQQLTRRVVQAARANLADGGFERLSLEGVARRAGVSRTAIYKRWPSFADLLLDVAVDALEDLGYPRNRLAMEQPDTGSLAGDLFTFFEDGLHRLVVLDRVGVARPLLAESILVPSLGERVRAALFTGDEAIFGRILETAVRRQEIADPGADAEHVFQTLIGYGIFRAYLVHLPLDGPGLQIICDTVSRGLARPSP